MLGRHRQPWSPRVGTKIWDAQDGRHVKDLPVGALCIVRFSPDGKWLLTTSGGCRLWSVGTWERDQGWGGTSANPTAAFSADGKLLALGDVPGMVRLVVTDTGREILTHWPRPDPPATLQFYAGCAPIACGE